MVFRKRGMRKLKRRPTVARKRTTRVSAAIKKYVKRTIHMDQENKVVNLQGSIAFGSVANNPSMYGVPILPYTGFGTISQGVGAGARIGNEIKLRKVMLKYVLRPLPYNVSTNPFPFPTEIDLFLGRTRGVPGEIPAAVDFNNLFQSGNTAFPPAGTLSDIISDVNTDYWTIKKRWRHKVGYSAYTGTGGPVDGQYLHNNDFNLNVVRKLNITSLCPKTLKFNDANNTVQGPNLFFFYQAINATGGSSTSTMLPCRIEYWIDIHFEDA